MTKINFMSLTFFAFEQVMIVVELLPKGDLKQYLDTMKPE